ncbi:MT-A70 family [Ophiocordyceps camponoti-floridani]|uniref:MT-A70 family n=1 Tax=Ophiocordyceps camponoti-floridani TaxID=2030778 RepID=A0A8H4QB64_9HYPO|nr:MT-A70 family [Ophiocordyceps camponoti-floridani]
MSSSILFRSPDASVILLDIPRSLEESQVPVGESPSRRLRSGLVPLAPLPTPEPKGGMVPVPAATQVADLMTAGAVGRALQVLADGYDGPFHLERCSSTADSDVDSDNVMVPVGARYICGPLEDTREALIEASPRFDLIVLDPPWPNRSVRRRKSSYNTPRTLPAVRRLLLQVPVAARLAANGLVAVWVTNKPAAHSLLTSAAGVFAAWGLEPEPVAEWTWLKIAASGQPLYDVDSTWRKPWERLVIAKRPGGCVPRALADKIMVAAPDLHSRKPSLRLLFGDVLERDDYVGLEVFARNLTAGWWSWGDEVVKFQRSGCWLPVSQEAC